MPGVDRTPVTGPLPSLVPGLALRPITRALECLQQPEARDIRYGYGWGRFEPQEMEGEAGLPGIAYSKSAGSKKPGLQAPGPETGQPAGTRASPHGP